jgi:hypothetical protein
MKTLLPTAFALALLLGLGLAQTPTPAPTPAPAPEQEESSAARLKALEAEVAALRNDVRANKQLLEEATRYLAGAKARSQGLLQTFDEAQQAGFTAGINYTSREILLAGFRAYASDEAAGLPGVQKTAEVTQK